MSEALARYETSLRKLALRARREDVAIEELEDVSLTVLRELDEPEDDDAVGAKE